MSFVHRLSVFEKIYNQSHVTAGIVTDEMASKMAKQVGNIEPHDLKPDRDTRSHKIPNRRCNSIVYVSTHKEIDCPG